MICYWNVLYKHALTDDYMLPWCHGSYMWLGLWKLTMWAQITLFPVSVRLSMYLPFRMEYPIPVKCRKKPIKFCSSGKDLDVVVIKSQDEKYWWFVCTQMVKFCRPVTYSYICALCTWGITRIALHTNMFDLSVSSNLHLACIIISIIINIIIGIIIQW